MEKIKQNTKSPLEKTKNKLGQNLPNNQSSQNTPKNLNRVSLEVENVVASITTGTTIDLDKVLETYEDVEAKSNFPGIIVRMKAPKATILIFKSGKMVLTGLTMVKYVPIVKEKVFNKLEYAGVTFTEEPIVKIQNIVVRGDFHTTINLDLSSLFLEGAVYEPEVFPGLIYKKKDPNICFLIFSSGKVIVTGANKESTIIKEVKILAKQLKHNGVFGYQQTQSVFNNTVEFGMLDLI